MAASERAFPLMSRVAAFAQVALLVLLLAIIASAGPASGHSNRVRRGITVNAEDIDTREFDYVIVGGGTAGLALASRLSFQPNRSVVVIEAGGTGDDVMERILTPAMTYLEGVSVPGSEYDWGYYTRFQNRNLHWPRGKLLGGSSAVNALYVVRASKAEHDAWASLNPNATQDWSWDGLFPYMKKTESWTAPSAANQTAAHIEVEPSYHGTEGPIQVAYPAFVYEQVAAWVPTLNAMGVSTHDAQGGEGWGAYITPNNISPRSQTRSYSRNAYLNPVINRPNLSVLIGYQVTRINFKSESGKVPRAVGVEFANPLEMSRYTVRAKREVILAAGVIGTPHVLQLSGVGPRALLESVGIPVVVDLPGVGEHLQDHVLVSLTFETSAAVSGDLTIQDRNFRNTQLDLYRAGRYSESLYSAPNNAIAYIDLEQLLGSTRAATFVEYLQGNKSAAVARLSSGNAVRRGYDLTYQTEVDKIINTKVGVIELLLSSIGSWSSTDKTLSIQAAIQHPFSRGYVRIGSDDPFTNPNITANYLTHPADIELLIEGVKYVRRVASTAPLSSLIVSEMRPGPSVDTDAEIRDWVMSSVATQYHPASSSSQLPYEMGGVVDTDLRVYGTAGLRIIDSSIIPIGLCAHLMGPTFAIAEKGADIILSQESSANTNPDSTASSAIISQILPSRWTLVSIFVLLRFIV